MENNIKKEYGIRAMQIREFNIDREIIRELNLRGVFTLGDFLNNGRWRIYIKSDDVLPPNFNEDLRDFESKILSII